MSNQSSGSIDLDVVETPINDLVHRFNIMQGKLRVSVTHACQLACRFCHREGIDNHWMPVHMSLDFLTSLVSAYADIGARSIELTGGEPTTHPRIDKLVDAIACQDVYLTLCTNGLSLYRLHEQIAKRHIQLIKLSLHATENSVLTRTLLGKPWDFAKIEKNVDSALADNANIQIIYTHTHQNSNCLDSVLQRALAWNVDLQIVDLISSRVGYPLDELGYMSGKESEDVVRRYATLQQEIRDRTGAVLKLYKTQKGKSWEIKDYHYGVLHSSMCDGCSKRPVCGEGIYALRVDAAGVIKPCLLRKDLQVSINVPVYESARALLEYSLRKMISGDLIWN